MAPPAFTSPNTHMCKPLSPDGVPSLPDVQDVAPPPLPLAHLVLLLTIATLGNTNWWAHCSLIKLFDDAPLPHLIDGWPARWQRNGSSPRNMKQTQILKPVDQTTHFNLNLNFYSNSFFLRFCDPQKSKVLLYFKLQQTWRCFSAFFLPPLVLILPSLPTPTSLFLPFLSLFSFFFTFSPSLSPLWSLLSDFNFSLAFFCVIIEWNAVWQLTLKSVPVKISTCQLSLTPLHKLWSLTRLLTYSYLIFMFILSLLHEKVQHHIISPSSSSKSWRQSFPGSGWSISSWGPPPPPG